MAIPSVEPQGRTGVALLAKAPVAGKVKTRMCPPCTPEQAAAFATAFLQDTAEMMNSPLVRNRVDGWCSYVGESDVLARIFGSQLLLQRGENFGERIGNATQDLFQMGYASDVALAADCPTVDAVYLSEALDLLRKYDVVFGPALDGGCVLVGLSKAAPQIFSDVQMSTDHVLDDMQQVAAKLGLRSATMASLHDLDTFFDLESAYKAGELQHARHTSGLLASMTH